MPPAFASVDDVIDAPRARSATSAIAASPPPSSSPTAWRSRSSSRARPASARPSWPRRSPRRSRRELIRLQCYEGLDEAKALYEWEYAKQLLYTQILRDKIGEVIAGARRRSPRPSTGSRRRTTRFFSERFLLAAPAARARSARRSAGVLLIDEVDRPTPSSRRSCSRCSPTSRSRCPSSARFKAEHMPARASSPRTTRASCPTRSSAAACTCTSTIPTPARELAIVQHARPEAAERARRSRSCASVQRVRELDLKKRPSISETLDWARALTC